MEEIETKQEPLAKSSPFVCETRNEYELRMLKTSLKTATLDEIDYALAALEKRIEKNFYQNKCLEDDPFGREITEKLLPEDLKEAGWTAGASDSVSGTAVSIEIGYPSDRDVPAVSFKCGFAWRARPSEPAPGSEKFRIVLQREMNMTARKSDVTNPADAERAALHFQASLRLVSDWRFLQGLREACEERCRLHMGLLLTYLTEKRELGNRALG